MFFSTVSSTAAISTLSLHDALPICPLFVVANVSPGLGPVTVNLSWSLTARPTRRPVDIQQDLYLLWPDVDRSEEHTSELQSHSDLVCRLLLEKKKKKHVKHSDSDSI